MQPGAKLQAYLGVIILQPHACTQRFRLRILRRTRSNAGRTSAGSLSGRIESIWETPSKERANPLNLHSPPAPCYMCYMCYMDANLLNLHSPRVLATGAICAIWVLHAKPNLHSPPAPCYMCYMCYIILYGLKVCSLVCLRFVFSFLVGCVACFCFWFSPSAGRLSFKSWLPGRSFRGLGACITSGCTSTGKEHDVAAQVSRKRMCLRVTGPEGHEVPVVGARLTCYTMHIWYMLEMLCV